MKRLSLIVFVAFLGFFCGWVGRVVILKQQFEQREKNLQEKLSYDNKRWQKKIKLIRQEIYENSEFRKKNVVSGVKAKMVNYTPSQSSEYIALAYIGGLGDSDNHLNLYGDGNLYSECKGNRQLIFKISPDRCKAFFLFVINSGILDYSESVVSIKEILLEPESMTGLTDAPNVEIQICVPRLTIDKKISIYAPEEKHKNFPDIIEYQIFTQIEKELLDLVPKNFVLWK